MHRDGLLIHGISYTAFGSQTSWSPRQNLELLPLSRILVAGLLSLVTKGNSPKEKQASTVLSLAASEFRFSLTFVMGMNHYFTLPIPPSCFNPCLQDFYFFFSSYVIVLLSMWCSCFFLSGCLWLGNQFITKIKNWWKFSFQSALKKQNKTTTISSLFSV